jgi:hypothetical protein
MERKIKLTTLGIEFAQEAKHPDGCPIIKAWRGNYSPAFVKTVKETFEIVEDQNADAFLLPSNVSFYSRDQLKEIGAKVSAFALPSIGFDISNECRKPGWLNHIIRFSWYRLHQEPGSIISPAYLGSDGFDIMAELGIRDLQPTEKEPLPSVSFCGREGGELGIAIWKILPRSLTRSMANSFFCSTTRGIRMICCYPLRVDAMQVMERDPRIKTDFIGRGKRGMQPITQGEMRRQFMENLMNNAYALCVRGSDNFSWRFYEALSVGKIPILIDTDCILPLEDEIPWDNFIVRVPSTRLDELPERLLEWHSRLSSASFRQLQKDIRSFFERLTPARYYPKIFRKILSGNTPDSFSLR